MHFRYHAEREKKSACNIRSLRSIEYPFHFLLLMKREKNTEGLLLIST